MSLEHDLENLNDQILGFFKKYRGITDLILLALIALTCIWLTIYFIDVHYTFKEIAKRPAEWCFQNYGIQITGVEC